MRGALQNKRRWFLLTSQEFLYLTENAGELIAAVPLEYISDVKDVQGSTRFEVFTMCPFGARVAGVGSQTSLLCLLFLSLSLSVHLL